MEIASEFIAIIRRSAMEESIKMLMFLVDEYNLKYSVQTFNNYPFGNYTTKTFSFYNDSGCFTIRYLSQKDELDFYFSSRLLTEVIGKGKRKFFPWTTPILPLLFFQIFAPYPCYPTIFHIF